MITESLVNEIMSVGKPPVPYWFGTPTFEDQFLAAASMAYDREMLRLNDIYAEILETL